MSSFSGDLHSRECSREAEPFVHPTQEFSNMKALFGAHQSFHIREGWLRKGLLGIERDPYLFSDPYAGDVLGVGHNMVSAIQYWLQATKLATSAAEPRGDKKVLRFSKTELAQVILENDPYFEEDGTLWVLHYQLATNKHYATTWFWFFSVFGGRHFTQDLFLSHLARYVEGDLRRKISPKTLEKDFRCLVRTYTRHEEKAKGGGFEDSFDSPLANLNLLQHLPLTNVYRLVTPASETLDPLLVCYALLEMRAQLPILPSEVSLRDALYEGGSPGRVFGLDSEILYEYLLRLSAEQKGVISFSRTAGLNLVTFRRTDPFEVLRRYYKGAHVLAGV